MGAFVPPVGAFAPTSPPTSEGKMAKNQLFLQVFGFLPNPPPPPWTHQKILMPPLRGPEVYVQEQSISIL